MLRELPDLERCPLPSGEAWASKGRESVINSRLKGTKLQRRLKLAMDRSLWLWH